MIFSCCVESCFNVDVRQLKESICFAMNYFEFFYKSGLSHSIYFIPNCQCVKRFLDVGHKYILRDGQNITILDISS